MPEIAEKESNDSICVRFNAATRRALDSKAANEKRTLSDIIRQFVDTSLKYEGYLPDDEHLRQLIREELSNILKPNVERLASISAKAANIDAASFFLLTFVAKLMLPPSESHRIEEASENARRLGIEYLKLNKNRDLDDFIQRGVNDMRDE